MVERVIRLRPRYYDRFGGPALPLREADCRHAELDWQVPLGQIALVCVDLWDRDVHADMREIDDRVTRRRIVPVVEACRRAGLLVLHAPSPPIARRSPNWVNLPADAPPVGPADGLPPWPPEEFLRKTGPFARYARPNEARRQELFDWVGRSDFHPDVRPVGEEPVIAVGEELHRLCARRGILHLVYVGFHTPGCMTGRSYGITQMLARGYTCILLRDCTNGMETHQTRDQTICLRGAIAFLEQTGVYTLTSEQFIAALDEASAPAPP